MSHHFATARFLVALGAWGTVALGAWTPQCEHPPEAGTHRHPQAAAIKNPVPASAASIAAGLALYQNAMLRLSW